ncbi:MAG: DUF2092 domain-containing protein [Ignavibacteria bacterium]|nr:DUF2092 domain-containing protein [Ignavibacteria bacterium]
MKLHRLFKAFILSVLFLGMHSGRTHAQIDSAAIAILDKVSFSVGNLQSCSLTLKTENDILDSRLGLVTHSETADVYLKAPDKLYVSKSGDKGNKEFFYDGKTFTYYSKDNNVYSSIPAPPTIIQTIDSIHNTFGIDFPAADFFYPYFVDDLLKVSNNLAYLGVTSVNNKKCFHLAGTTLDVTYQIWIADDGTFLPVKLSIVSVNNISDRNYSALYENWSLNPALQNSMFDFNAPADAMKVRIAVKK